VPKSNHFHPTAAGAGVKRQNQHESTLSGQRRGKNKKAAGTAPAAARNEEGEFIVYHTGE